ncbi:MAG: hypothetical protein NPMRD1_190026 [Nitrosopumilales archaeon]|jgi:hypothetical protein|nr:MAG: hypothetical protein NPMRD1_190026 [Nitrosopumilales archaeon]
MFLGMLEQKLEGHRITIILDDNIVKNLRKKQAKMLIGTSKSVTLTSVIKEILRDSFGTEKI